MSHRVKLNKNILANGAVSTQPHWPIKSQNVVGERMSPWKVHIIISRDVKLFCSSKERMYSKESSNSDLEQAMFYRGGEK